MKADKIYKDRLKYIDKSLSSFDKELRALQVELFDTLLIDYISRLQKGAANEILMNGYNARLLLELDKELKLFAENFASGTFAKLGERMLGMLGLTSKYFRALTGKKAVANIASKLDSYRAFVGIDKKGNVLKGSFIDHLANSTELKQSLSSYIQKGIEGKSDYKTFVQGFKDLVKGSQDTQGIYEKYAGGYVNDAFHTQAQVQENFFADELGLDYFVYEGELVEKSRPFCQARHGQTFSREEAEMWDSEEWQGKIPDVPFIMQRGGYNCRHYLRWITDEQATTNREVIN